MGFGAVTGGDSARNNSFNPYNVCSGLKEVGGAVAREHFFFCCD